jgi:hypothetical protein
VCRPPRCVETKGRNFFFSQSVQEGTAAATNVEQRPFGIERVGHEAHMIAQNEIAIDFGEAARSGLVRMPPVAFGIEALEYFGARQGIEPHERAVGALDNIESLVGCAVKAVGGAK